ncbi:CCXG family PEP-CTERM protein [Aquabacterium sp.]|uniref:CCXG family PEP-CTERM protein n=1 Tax=Aquabacterium sp. TaxID=1872578 RepID=UPI003782F783
MNIRSWLVAGLSCLPLALSSGPASASLITLHTRASGAAAAPAGSVASLGSYYHDTIEAALAGAPGAGYCDVTLSSFADTSNHGSCSGGSSSNIAFAYKLDFGLDAAQGGDFSMRLGVDFGKGGAVFLDGQLLDARNTDLWWAGNWSAGSQLFQFSSLALGAGNHELAIYGLEGCCDGGQRGEYRIGANGSWTAFAAGDGLIFRAAPASVPEPRSLALVLSAMLGLAATRQLQAARKRKRAD